MAQQEIDVGSIAGDGTGDPLRDAFTKINENFTELYSGNVQVTAANVLVESVAGRIGNVVLTVNDIAQAASKSYVDNSISANLANVTSTITNSLSANITAANLIIDNHESRITTLESNAASQAVAITNLNNTKATISYVDTSINLALSSNAILANVVSVNANVAAANIAILTKANVNSPNFLNNVSVTGNIIATEHLRVGANYYYPTYNGNIFGGFYGSTLGTGRVEVRNVEPTGLGAFLAFADDSDSTPLGNYIALGISNSEFVDLNNPKAFPHDGFIYNVGGNLIVESLTHDLWVMTANVIRTKWNSNGTITLNSGTSLIFPDGTIQTTAFGGNTDAASINANITAANVAIASLHANASSQSLELAALTGNAATQAVSINILLSNAATQAVSINLLNANIDAYQTLLTSNAAGQATSINLLNANIIAANLQIDSLAANAATQALELDNLQGNAQAQQNNIISLLSNSSAQAVQIDSINANVTASNASISSLSASLSTQTTQINLLNANLTAANLNIVSLTSNAASQALDIQNLYANVNFYLSNVSTSNANIAAANARIITIDANLGTTNTNVTNLQSNAAAQAVLIDLLNANVSAANVNINNKADLSGAIFSGNVQADFLLVNANVKVGSTLAVGNDNLIDYAGLGAIFVGNVDGFYQVVIQNTNTGSSASGDFVIIADDGDISDKYLNIGINSSNFSGTFATPLGDTGLNEAPYDGYFNVIGGNAIVRTNRDVFLVANTSVAGITKDGDFVLFSCNLRFNDGSTQASAITDVPGLYANIGTLALFQSNVLGNATYTPNNAANYNGTITNIQEALDELAARLRALGG